MSTPQGYDFGQLYGMADHSSITPLEPASYDAVVEEAEFGRTRDGTKEQWTIKFRVTTGDRAGYPLTMTLSVNPVKNDGTPNAQGMGIMFRQLHAMGVPVGPPVGPQGETPFWQLGWTGYNVAQAIMGKPVLLRTVNDDSYDGTPRTKVKDIKEPRPGAPLQVQQVQQPQGQPAMPYGQQPGQFPQQQQMQPAYGGGQQMQPNGYPQQPQGQPGYGYPGQQQQQQQVPQGPTAPGPWQNAQPQQGQPQQPQQVPGAPGWAPQAQPGQGGMGEFTPQGQSFQGYQGQAPPNGGQQYQQAPPPQQPPQGYGAPGTGAPAPGAQFQPGAPSPSYGQPQQPQPQQGQQDPNQQQQGAPNLPPWAS